MSKKILKAKKAETPVAEQPKAKVETKAEAKPVKPSINKGRTTGMRIMEFQDHSLVENATHKLSDEALAKVWREEFPHARCHFTADIVAGVRRLFNAGKHGSQKLTAPKGGVLRYDDHGNVVAERGRKAKAKTETKAA